MHDYDAWKTGYYEPTHEFQHCYQCSDHHEQIEKASSFLEKIVKQLYSNQELNVLALEGNLDELCHLLGVDLIPGDINLQRKKSLCTWMPAAEEILKLNQIEIGAK